MDRILNRVSLSLQIAGIKVTRGTVVFELDRKSTIRSRPFNDNLSSNNDFFFSSNDN